MSQSKTPPIRAKCQSQEGVIGTIDNSNIDAFFCEPSPHEFLVTSEMRVHEIIEDLHRRTTEEIENWSCSQGNVHEPKKQLHATNTKSGELLNSRTAVISVKDDLVSSPISFLSSSSIKAGSNMTLATKLQAERERIQFRTEVKSLAAAAPTQANPLPLSNKPSFRSFLKRVAKTPPPPASVCEHACSTPQTPALKGTQSTALPAMLAVIGFPETSERLRPTEALASKHAATVSVLLPAATSGVPISSSTKTYLKASVVLGADRASAFPMETALASKNQPRKPRPRSPCSLLLPAIPPFMTSASPKRKPLPQDSPLLMSLRQHPAFANMKLTKGRTDAAVEDIDTNIRILREQIEKGKEDEEAIRRKG